MIKDSERLKFLKDGGYLPYGFNPDSVIVDWAIEHKYCPAYWRKPENYFEIEENRPPNGNGMVFVKSGDRNRIDQIILKIET